MGRIRAGLYRRIGADHLSFDVVALRRKSGYRPGPPSARSAVVVATLAVSAVLLSACGEDEPPGPTIEERLADAEGRELTASEVDEKLALGNTLCRMDEPILGAIWLRLNDVQMAYQDVVFGHLCPERSIFYAGQTGRLVTEEAEKSGIVTSTTGPGEVTTSSTAATGSESTTAGGATIAPAPSEPETTADPATSTSAATTALDSSDGSGSTATTQSTQSSQPSQSTASTATTSTTATTTAATGSTGPGEGG